MIGSTNNRVGRYALSSWVMLILLVAFPIGLLAQKNSGVESYRLVNPMIGTAGDGNTVPAATLPFGMIQWGPDTSPGKGYLYRYADTKIRGFSMTHMSGPGCPIYGDIPVLPWTGAVTENPAVTDSYSLSFSHDHEHASPGYYEVETEDGVHIQLAVSERSGMGRFVFPAGKQRTLLIEAGSSANSSKRPGDSATIALSEGNIATGIVHSGGFCNDFKYTLYFAMQFSQPFVATGAWDSQMHPGATSASGHKAGGWVSFGVGSEPILLKIGLSYVSSKNARANLDAEIGHRDFDAVRSAGVNAWTEALSKIEIKGGTPDQRTLFYTGLYHMLQAPNLFSDVNGDYIGMDGKIRRLGKEEAQYANFSDWDIYRDIIQFHAWLFPQQSNQMMESLLRDADQTGTLVRWPAANDVTWVMGGDAPSIELAEAYAFGDRGFDARKALHYMIQAATVPPPSGSQERQGLDEYLQKGYLSLSGGANERAASVSLEYNAADFATSRLALVLGDAATADRLLRSSQNWKHLYDPESGTIRPRQSDGTFLAGWDPIRLLPHKIKSWDTEDQMGFEEGSAWQYTFMIPFDYAGLFRAMGGPSVAVPSLDRFFTKLSGWNLPNYTVANEPDFCAPYAYDWLGVPWKTQEVVTRIQQETFFNRPDGLPGNDDLGATSGVYVWNALGMYPVIPGVGGMALGTPMFPKAHLKLGNGRTLDIETIGNGIYVQRVLLNGRKYSSTWLPLESLTKERNTMIVWKGNHPNLLWGAGSQDAPPSFDLQP